MDGDTIIKHGFQIAEDLFTRIKVFAAQHHMRVVDITDSAYREFLARHGENPLTDAGNNPRLSSVPEPPLLDKRGRKAVDRLLKILLSRHNLAVSAIAKNLEAFEELVDATAGNRVPGHEAGEDSTGQVESDFRREAQAIEASAKDYEAGRTTGKRTRGHSRRAG